MYNILNNIRGIRLLISVKDGISIDISPKEVLIVDWSALLYFESKSSLYIYHNLRPFGFSFDKVFAVPGVD